MLPAIVLLFSAILPFFLIPLALYPPTRVHPSLPGHVYARLSLLTIIPTTDVPPPVTTFQLLPSATSTAALEILTITDTTVTAIETKMTTDLIVYVPPDYQTTDFYSILGTILPFLFIIVILRHSGIVSSPAATPTPLTSTTLSSPQPPDSSFPAHTAPSSSPAASPTPNTAKSVHYTSERNFFKDAYCSTPLHLVRCVNQSNGSSDSTVLFGLETTATTTTTSISDSDLEASSNLSLKKPANTKEELAEPLSPARLFNIVNSEFSQEPVVVLAPPGSLIAPAIPITLSYQGATDPLNIAGFPPSPAAPLPSDWSQAFQPTVKGDRLSPGALFGMTCNDYETSFLMNSGYKCEPLAAYDPIIRSANETQDTVSKSTQLHPDDPSGSTCDAILADIMSSIRRANKATSLPYEPLPGVHPLPDPQPRPTANVLDESLSDVFAMPEHPVPPSPPPSQQPPSPPPQSQAPPVPSPVVQAAGAMKIKSKLRQPMRRPLAVTLIIGRLLGPPSKLRQPTPRPVWVDAIVEKYGTPNRPRYPSATAPRRVALKNGNLNIKKTSGLITRV